MAWLVQMTSSRRSVCPFEIIQIGLTRHQTAGPYKFLAARVILRAWNPGNGDSPWADGDSSPNIVVSVFGNLSVPLPSPHEFYALSSPEKGSTSLC